MKYPKQVQMHAPIRNMFQSTFTTHACWSNSSAVHWNGIDERNELWQASIRKWNAWKLNRQTFEIKTDEQRQSAFLRLRAAASESVKADNQQGCCAILHAKPNTIISTAKMKCVSLSALLAALEPKKATTSESSRWFSACAVYQTHRRHWLAIDLDDWSSFRIGSL